MSRGGGDGLGEVAPYQAPHTWFSPDSLRPAPSSEFITRLLKGKYIASLTEGETLVQFIRKFKVWRAHHNLTQEKVCKLLNPETRITSR